jgi:tetratricopeptide (TPR) repeat protein
MKTMHIILLASLLLSCATTQNPGVHFNKAREISKDGNYEAALKEYDKAIELAPQWSTAYYFRGTAKYQTKRYQAAIDDFTKAIEITPKYPAAIHDRALARRALKDNRGAMSDLDRAIQGDPEYFPLAYANRASLRIELKDFQGAIPDADKAILQGPDYPGGYIVRAEAKIHLAHYDSAIQDLSKAMDLKPKNDLKAEVLYLRALIKFKLKQGKNEYCGDALQAFQLGYLTADNGFGSAENSDLTSCK